MESVARIHWIGKDRISTNIDFMRLWTMSESLRLEEQTLDKLSAGPWRFIRSQSNPASTNLLHPLLQDLVDHEFYLQIDQPTGSANQPGELVLAIRLTDSRARLWQTNVVAALESLTPLHVDKSSSGRHFLKKHHVPNLIEITRVGQWTLLGAAQDHNRLLDQTVSRIQSSSPPFQARDSNCWLEADIDLARATVALGHALRLPPNFPAVSLALAGDGNAVHTHGELRFSQPLGLHLKPWNIPTNLINGEFAGFTAVRGGTPPFLSRFWKQFDSNSAPDQFYIWSFIGAPMEVYLAAPAPDASNAVSRLSDFVVAHAAAWFQGEELVGFRKAGFNGLEWKGAPFITPFVKSVETPSGDFVMAGFFPPITLEKPLPDELIRELQIQTNLVFYDSELTRERLQQLTYLSQLIRTMMNKPQLPPRSAAMSWLGALSWKLGKCRTEVALVNPQQLSFDRTASTPFTAIELHLLADWLESPSFPFGFFSLSPSK
jgi:hypothetical protein